MGQEIKRNGIYRHFKGDYYLVEELAEHSETGETYVVYLQLYGENRLFVRPLAMFASPVDREKYPNATQEYRFQLQNIHSVNRQE